TGARPGSGGQRPRGAGAGNPALPPARWTPPASPGSQPHRTSPGSQPHRASPGSQPHRTSPGSQPHRASPGSQPHRTSPGSQPHRASPGSQPHRTSPGSQPHRASPGSQPHRTSPGSKHYKPPLTPNPANLTCFPTLQTPPGFSSRCRSCFLLTSAKERTMGSRLFLLLSFWWWCFFSSTSRTLARVRSSNSGDGSCWARIRSGWDRDKVRARARPGRAALPWWP
uniref:Uncharacterized protein n=1 Tax=Ficedula albicollis TaxID=59894 RepID=A0A803V6E4_FICAL